MKNYEKISNSGGVFLNTLFILSIVFAGVTVFQQKTVCEKPLEYSIDGIDGNFDVTKKEFQSLAADAENIWEDGTGMNLFTYNKDAEFKINLIFDERQRATITEKRSRESLNKNNTVYDELVKQYNTKESLYNNRFSQFKNKLNLYEKQLSSYNDKVKYYNNTGGASVKKYNELAKEKKSLKSEASQLEQEKKELNSIGNQVNLSVKKINSFASSFNSEVNRYNKSFGTSKIFDQGEYTGNEINIYQFDGIGDLRIVLAHEFGHALNLDHVENNPTSIMYYLMEDQDLKKPKLSEEDINALKIECGL